MTKDSCELLARIGTALYDPDALTRQEADALYDTLDALVAEVERLRAEVSLLQQEARIRQVINDGLRAEVDAERAAVVAWLRAALRLHYADCIERGEHRREEVKP